MTPRKHTLSLCPICYAVSPATLDAQDGQVVMTSRCALHGEQRRVAEPDVQMWKAIQEFPQLDTNRPGITMLDVTRRCNVRCPGCYVAPDKSADTPIAELLSIAHSATSPLLGLMGAEPTMREDLPELIRELKKETRKPILLHTNGIRLAEPGYAERLVEAGLDKFCLSLHTPDYIGENFFLSKLDGLLQAREAGLVLENIGFSPRNSQDLPMVLEIITNLGLLPGEYIRLRAPSANGGWGNSPMHMGEFLKEIECACASQGLPLRVLPFTHHAYAVLLEIAGVPVLVIRWPEAGEIDLVEAEKGPVKALFVKALGEVQILWAILVQGKQARERKMGGR